VVQGRVGERKEDEVEITEMIDEKTKRIGGLGGTRVSG
jgi:hypothetical protein